MSSACSSPIILGSAESILKNLAFNWHQAYQAKYERRQSSWQQLTEDREVVVARPAGQGDSPEVERARALPRFAFHHFEPSQLVGLKSSWVHYHVKERQLLSLR